VKIDGHAAVVTGGGSGLGAETARELARRGAKVAVLDINEAAARALADEIGGIAAACDITDAASVSAALDASQQAHGPLRMLMNVAGIGSAKRIVGRDGTAAPLEDFERVVRINLIGTYNVSRLAAARMVAAAPLEDDERGVIVCTASVAAFDGQVGQEAYAASKGGVAAMTLPMARDLAQFGVRVVTIAPGLFLTPMLLGLPKEAQDSLGKQVPFPSRLGKPEEYASLAKHIVENEMLNGETIRLDGAIRMAPK